MVDISVSNCEGIAARAKATRARFVATGTNISAWARENGFSPKLVHQVLRGGRSCNFGESHRIAVKLGLKDAPLLEAAE